MTEWASPVPQDLRAAFVAVLRAAADRSFTMTRTKVAKLLYLCDLRAVESGLEPFTGADWKWHHYGPFDMQLLAVENALVNAGPVERVVTNNIFGSPEYRLAVPSEQDVDLDKAFWDIVCSVVGELGHSAPTTLKDLTYQTAPMQTAQERGERGVPLDLSEVRPLPEIGPVLRRLRRIRDELPAQSTDDGAFDDLHEELAELGPKRRAATRAMLED